VDWFPGQWQAILDANPDRYGSSWFRGCYHYLEMKDDPVEQAKYYLSTIEKAGGWSLSPKGDLLPIVDVEWNSPGSAQQLIEYTSAWSATIKTELGCETILYGRNAMSESNPPINSRMGCSYLWNPSYTASMPSTEDIGWPDDRVKLWQYTDGSSPRSAWPNKVPGMTGLCDINRFLGDSLDDLKSLCF
jgi:GH25 family lysozyme M1 (1,4-beta-N-acetylmuramidase)